MISITLDLHFSRKNSDLVYDVGVYDFSNPFAYPEPPTLVNVSEIKFNKVRQCKYIEININGKRFGF